MKNSNFYRKVPLAIWNRHDFRAISQGAKLCFIRLLTHSDLTALGWLVYSPDSLGRDLGMSKRKVKLCLAELEEAGLCRQDNEVWLLWLPCYLAWNMPENGRQVAHLCADTGLKLPDCPLAREMVGETARMLASRNRDWAEQFLRDVGGIDADTRRRIWSQMCHAGAQGKMAARDPEWWKLPEAEKEAGDPEKAEAGMNWAMQKKAAAFEAQKSPKPAKIDRSFDQNTPKPAKTDHDFDKKPPKPAKTDHDFAQKSRESGEIFGAKSINTDTYAGMSAELPAKHVKGERLKEKGERGEDKEECGQAAEALASQEGVCKVCGAEPAAILAALPPGGAVCESMEEGGLGEDAGGELYWADAWRMPVSLAAGDPGAASGADILPAVSGRTLFAGEAGASPVVCRQSCGNEWGIGRQAEEAAGETVAGEVVEREVVESGGMAGAAGAVEAARAEAVAMAAREDVEERAGDPAAERGGLADVSLAIAGGGMEEKSIYARALAARDGGEYYEALADLARHFGIRHERFKAICGLCEAGAMLLDKGARGQVAALIPLRKEGSGGPRVRVVATREAAEWRKEYPLVDLAREIRKLLEWNLRNPGRRKTARGIAGHIRGWLARAQNDCEMALARGGSAQGGWREDRRRAAADHLREMDLEMDRQMDWERTRQMEEMDNERE